MSARRTIGQAIRLTAARRAYEPTQIGRLELQARLNAQLAAQRGYPRSMVEVDPLPRTLEAGLRAMEAKREWWIKVLRHSEVIY